MRYLNGEGIEADAKVAYLWLDAAAKRAEVDGNQELVALSTYHLGQLHEQGLGTDRDPVQALRLYEKASGKNEDARASFERLKAKLAAP